MINNKLKINDSKTEFIVFRSPQAKQDLSGLSVIVGDSIIQQSSKVRNLGIIFDQFLSFDDYISSVCRSTHFHLRNIGRIRHLLSQNATAVVVVYPLPWPLLVGGSPMFPLVVHQPAVQSLRWGLSTNPGATMQPLSLYMHSFRFVLTTATQYYTTSLRTVF